MRHIHPAAWVGLLLNFGLTIYTFSTLGSLDLSGLEGQDKEMVEAVITAVMEVQPLYYVMLAGQAVALGLIVTGLGFGLGLAALAAFFFMPPLNMIYLIGCALTHFRIKYAAFRKAPQGRAGAHFTFPAFALKMARVLTGALLLSALISMFIGLYDIGVIFFSLGLGGIYCVLRAAKNHALSLYDDFFTLTPGLLAERLLIPYNEVRKATLNEDESILFEVEGPAGAQALAWSLRSLWPEDRRAGLEELAAALTARDVPLY